MARRYGVVRAHAAKSSRNTPKITLTITNNPNEGGFIAYIFPIEEVPITINLSLDRLDDHAASLYSSSRNLVNAINDSPNNIDIIIDRIVERPNGLARRGYNTLNAIFGADTAAKLCNIDTSRASTFVVHSNVFFFPWDLLFRLSIQNFSRSDTNFDLHQLIKEFWAYHKIVGVMPYYINSNEKDLHTRNYPKKPKIGLICDPKLKYAKEEFAFFEGLDRLGKISLSTFTEWNAVGDDLVYEINDFFTKEKYDIIHISCHAVFDPEENIQFITLNNNRYFINDLDDDPVIEALGEPIVFLNICNTSHPLEKQWTSKKTWDFVSAFRSKGGTNIIALESLIFDSIARDMTVRFYNYLLQGVNIGEALHEARKEIIGRRNSLKDITALFYTAYCDPDITLQ